MSENGPNQTIPAENYRSINANGAVKLLIPEDGNEIEMREPISIPALLERTANEYPDQIALRYKDIYGKWQEVTYRNYMQQVRICAKAFLKIGLQRYHGVCILGKNCPEWFISNLATIYAGGFSVGVYTINKPDDCLHCAESSGANIIIVDDARQAEKIQLIRYKLKDLKAIVQMFGEVRQSNILSWTRLMQIGKRESDSKLEEILKKLAVNECCTLVYTSGTIGNPKPLMISQDNLTWTAQSLCDCLQLKMAEECIISYLPLSHISTQVIDIYCMLITAGTISFADRDAFKGTLINTVKEVQPTRFFSIPRIWEKIYEKLKQIEQNFGYLKKVVITIAESYGFQHYRDQINGINSNSLGYKVSRLLVFGKVKEFLGFSKCRTFISSSAPLSARVKTYLMSLDIPIIEAFGMSESSGEHILNNLGGFGLETVGRSISGTKIKVIDSNAVGQGELCMYGRNICMGYLNDSVITEETIDEEGWLHSGDLGYIDQKGLVYITGRLKELIITSIGEKVFPVPIEDKIKSNLPHISNCMLVGDQKRYLSLLITLKTEIDRKTGKPLNNLANETRSWLLSLECPANTLTDVLNAGPHRNLLKCIQNAIDEINKNATSTDRYINKFVILPRDFTTATGEFGPTMKLKRLLVAEMYSHIINGLYVNRVSINEPADEQSFHILTEKRIDVMYTA